jgi:hypothetical protein
VVGRLCALFGMERSVGRASLVEGRGGLSFKSACQGVLRRDVRNVVLHPRDNRGGHACVISVFAGRQVKKCANTVVSVAFTAGCHICARGTDRDAGQLQLIFSRVYDLSAWDLDRDNALYNYHVNLF